MPFELSCGYTFEMGSLGPIFGSLKERARSDRTETAGGSVESDRVFREQSDCRPRLPELEVFERVRVGMANSAFLKGVGARSTRWPIARRVLLSVVFGLGLTLGTGLPSFAGAAPDPLFDDDFYDEVFEYPDPLESTNRKIFAFNQQVDKWVLDPVTKAYRWAVPKPIRLALARVFINLGSTKTLANDFLQLEWQDAAVTTTRLVVNSTFGIAGLFDVAEKIGLDGHESDFGQTLALAGVSSGPYLIYPLLGPGTVRDGMGTIIDGFFQPTYYIIGPADLLFGPTEILLYSGSSGISTRDRHFLELKALEESSVDFYAALRSGFYQNRVDEIWGRRPDHRTTQDPGSEADTTENEDDSL
jgi:phospholipid-binding lipoprotein MlaA